MFFNPLEQFEVIIYLNFSILNFDFSLTNSGFYMFLITVVPLILFSLSFWFSYVISNSWQLFVELLYKFVLNLFVRQTGQLSALRYFPLFFCVFLFVLFSNLLGLLPFGFTVTSHILITAFIAFFIFVGITFRGFFKYTTFIF
jgi:F0F1-type ATP synthase membrane subunit a